MKSLFTIFFCVLFAMAGAQPKNDWQEDQLRGKVKSLRAIPYKVKGGEGTAFSKGEIEDDDDLVVFKMSNIYNKYKRYNPEGMLVETRFLFKDETIYLRSEYYYNPQGKLFMERQNSDKIMFVYDPQGFLVKEVTYSPGGFLKSHIDYEVDAQGRREKETYYMSNAPTESTTYQYNRKGQVIESIKYEKEGNFVEKRLFKYNTQGLVVRIRTYNKDNRLIKTSDKTYNPQGDCIRWEVHNKTTKVKIVETYQYSYDTHNNWVSAVYFVNGSPTQIIERTLDYYE
jgi:hypothetical protein